MWSKNNPEATVETTENQQYFASGSFHKCRISYTDFSISQEDLNQMFRRTDILTDNRQKGDKNSLLELSSHVSLNFLMYV